MKCPNCSSEQSGSFCVGCGTFLTQNQNPQNNQDNISQEQNQSQWGQNSQANQGWGNNGQSQWGQNSQGSGNNPVGGFNSQPLTSYTQTSTGKGVASLVLGIISLLCCCTGYGGLILGALGLIFGILQMKSNKNGLAIAGIILSIIAMIAGIIALVMFIHNSEFWEEVWRQLEEQGYEFIRLYR